MVKNLHAIQETWGRTGSVPGLGRYPGGGNGYPLQDSCWKIPWTEEPGRLYMGSQGAGHD